jgi:hypothetical protein
MSKQLEHVEKFPQWPLSQVIEVALTLYAQRPFKLDDEYHWPLLVRRAFDFLDNVHKAYPEIVRHRRAAEAAYRRAEKRRAERAALPEIVPFDIAIRHITRERWTKRAEPKFKTLIVSAPPRYFPAMNKRQLHAGIVRWQKSGIPRDLVIDLQSLHDALMRITREERQAKRARAKKRKPNFTGMDRYEPEIREVIREIDAQRKG